MAQGMFSRLGTWLLAAVRPAAATDSSFGVAGGTGTMTRLTAAEEIETAMQTARNRLAQVRVLETLAAEAEAGGAVTPREQARAAHLAAMAAQREVFEALARAPRLPIRR